MALSPLSAGDILMLSQQAWRIGRAFTPGRSGAVSEFEEVEREANGLNKALKLTAETLYSDDSILSKAEPETRGAVYEILESAGRTLDDLESFVDSYQVIKKEKTEGGGFVVQKVWSKLILANYKTIKWTTEGNNITELRNILHLHTNTITLTTQALQSRSLSRLERTVMPMAENIASIHSRINGDLAHKIDDLHRLVMSLSNSTPSLVARDRPIETNRRPSSSRRDTASSSIYSVDSLDMETQKTSLKLLETNSPKSAELQPQHDSVLSTPAPIERYSSANQASPPSKRRNQSSGNGEAADWDFETGSPSRLRGSIGGLPVDTSDSSSEPDMAKKKLGSSRRDSSTPRRESTTLPNLFGTMSMTNDSQATRIESASRPKRALSYEQSISPTSPSRTKPTRFATSGTVLPPPAIPSSPSSSRSITQSPTSVLDHAVNNPPSQRQRDHSNSTNIPPTSPKPGLASLPAFEKSLFRNAAILCDVRGKLVEYAQKVPDEPDPRYNVEMVEACQECRICVIRKRENRAHGGTKLTTSIWAISEDGSIRCQQKLSDVLETIPYCSYFEREKVSISSTEEGEILLKFHGENWTDELDKEAKTNWTNYVFVAEIDAIAFQSAVFGRKLIGSFRTTKTTVIHDGIRGTFAFEEQFANIEMLRLWEDDGVATQGGQGGVLALMHISSNFGEGWARWWINCSRHKVRLRDDPPKHAKLKGIDVLVLKPGESTRRLSTTAELRRTNSIDANAAAVKKVTGIRIEFKTEREKDEFVRMTNRAQENLLPLPDLHV